MILYIGAFLYGKILSMFGWDIHQLKLLIFAHGLLAAVS
jgi:hypothetical protein